MATLFETTTLGGLTLRNRFVRSATWEGLAGDDGSVTPALTEKMVELARGEVGFIITSHAFVRPDGRAGMRQLGVYDDGLLPGLAALTEAVHAAGGRIALQLAHAGMNANTDLSGLPAVGPSVVPGLPACEALDAAGIATLVDAFAQAAARAKQAGFDAVQIHAAHGYLLNQFLSPAWNRRDDAYGGAVEQRARMLLEILAAVRAAVGPHFPVLAKINAEDFVENGQTVDDALAVAALLEAAGLDGLELSGGCKQAGPSRMPARKGRIRSRDEEVYYRRAAARLKERLCLPLILVGGIRSFETAESLVDTGAADYVALARPLVCEPDLVKRWRAGDCRPALCVSDNACYIPILAGQGIACPTFAKKRGQTAG
jgi:2,4-dienoyl-CoA reductase-like NADH-dependent reductase (Old Yellow Enzyme family)